MMPEPHIERAYWGQEINFAQAYLNFLWPNEAQPANRVASRSWQNILKSY